MDLRIPQKLYLPPIPMQPIPIPPIPMQPSYAALADHPTLIAQCLIIGNNTVHKSLYTCD